MSISYTVATIRELLANYAALEAGSLPSGDTSYAEYWGPKVTKRSNPLAPHEVAVLIKCDLDMAIQRLPPVQKFILMAVDIDERPIADCAYWLGKSVGYVVAIEDKAVRRMAGILNGQTEFRGGHRPGAGRKSNELRRDIR